MVMGLCLLIYALAEHLLRSALRRRGETLPDQKGEPTQSITMRRVFQVFEGIHVLLIRSAAGPPPFDGLRTPQRMVLNLTDLHRRILGLLGPEPQKRYALLEWLMKVGGGGHRACAAPVIPGVGQKYDDGNGSIDPVGF
jgi:hypothetical protein